MTEPAQVPAEVQATFPVKNEDLVADMQSLFTDLEAAFAGFNHLHGAYLTFTKKLPPGERAKGMPIFGFPASINGRDSSHCEIDLQYLNSAYLPGVLGPLIEYQHLRLRQVMHDLNAHILELDARMSKMLPETKTAAPA